MKKKERSQFLLESLEPRLLFSADLAPVPVDGGGTGVENESNLEISLRPEIGAIEDADVKEQTRREVIFVDEAVDEITYFHFLLDKHQVVYAEGVPSESLFTGPEALKALAPEVREEIFAIIPEAIVQASKLYPARLIPSNAVQNKIVLRHLKNQKSLLN